MNNPPLILVVDDDWMSRELLQAHLDGYEVMMANNGEKALQMAALRPPDLVIVDVRMPGISGYEFCARLRADEAINHVPVLMLSALEGDEPRRRALEAGANDLMNKPFDSVVLIERVRGFVSPKSPLNK
jgi:two-component system cell cycle response regulator